MLIQYFVQILNRILVIDYYVLLNISFFTSILTDSAVVETNMTAIDCHWNHNGTILAAAGCTNEQSNAVQFFSAYGEVCFYYFRGAYILYWSILDLITVYDQY